MFAGLIVVILQFVVVMAQDDTDLLRLLFDLVPLVSASVGLRVTGGSARTEVFVFCFRVLVGPGGACCDGFRLRPKNTKTGCVHIWMLSGSSSAVVGLVLRLGRVPAPPSQLFKDAPDPTSQGGVGNRN